MLPFSNIPDFSIGYSNVRHPAPLFHAETYRIFVTISEISAFATCNMRIPPFYKNTASPNIQTDICLCNLEITRLKPYIGYVIVRKKG
nr:MAG TPA: hypothetical protein [Caudoviricetes sp.]